MDKKYIHSFEIIQTFPQYYYNPLQLRTMLRVCMQALPHYVKQNGRNDRLTIHKHIFRKLKPPIQVSSIKKYFFLQDLVIEIERIFANK